MSRVLNPTHRAGLPPTIIGVHQARAPVSWWALGALLISGTILRVIGMNRDLWIDEIATVVHYMRLPFFETFTFYGSANQHMLYSALGSLSLSAFGESAWAARLPAVLFGVGSLAGLYTLARLFLHERDALLATALMTFSYHHVWFSQNARGYSGMIFFILWGTFFFVRGLMNNRQGDWAAYALSMALGMLILQNTAFVFAAHSLLYLALVALRWHGIPRFPLLGSVAASNAAVLGLTLLGYLPSLPQIVQWYATQDRTAMGWNDIAGFAGIVLQNLGGRWLALTPIVIVVGFVMAIGFVRLWRQSALIAGLIVLPPLFNVVALVLLNFGAYPRSFLYVLPFACIVLIHGGRFIIETIAERVVPRLRAQAGTVLLAGGVALSAVTVLYNYAYPKQDYTGALAYARERAGPGDTIAAIGLAAGSYRDYYAPDLAFPDTTAALDTFEDDGAVWVLYSFPRDMRLRFPELYDDVQARYEAVAIFPGTLEEGSLYVMVHR